jgi:hypothetical protein
VGRCGMVKEIDIKHKIFFQTFLGSMTILGDYVQYNLNMKIKNLNAQGICIIYV